MYIGYLISIIYRCDTTLLSKIALQLKFWEIKVMSFLEISYITNVSSVRIYIGTTMGYPTLFSISGKLKKKDLKYHNSILHDKIHFDWSGPEFKYQDKPIFFPSTIQVVPLDGTLKLGN